MSRYRKMDTVEEMLAMDMNEHHLISVSVSVTRVPGGWVYSFSDKVTKFVQEPVIKKGE